jgi:hypothetical protein
MSFEINKYPNSTGITLKASITEITIKMYHQKSNI